MSSEVLSAAVYNTSPLPCFIKYHATVSMWETNGNDPVREWTVQLNQTEPQTIL